MPDFTNIAAILSCDPIPERLFGSEEMLADCRLQWCE
jgi:hypothetical protein